MITKVDQMLASIEPEIKYEQLFQVMSSFNPNTQLFLIEVNAIRASDQKLAMNASQATRRLIVIFSQVPASLTPLTR